MDKGVAAQVTQDGGQYLVLLLPEAGEGGVVGDVGVVVLSAQPDDAEDVALSFWDPAYLVSVEEINEFTEKIQLRLAFCSLFSLSIFLLSVSPPFFCVKV